MESPACLAAGAAESGAAREPGTPIDRRVALLLALVAMVVFNLNCRSVGAGDTYSTRVLPFALLAHHTLLLDDVLVEARAGFPAGRVYWVLPARDGHWASMYPVVTPVLVTPLYLPAKLWLDARGWDAWRVAVVVEAMEKLSASLVASLTCGLLFLLLRRRVARAPALLLAIAFAFGTNTWMTASQALWQHGAAELFVVVALLCVTARERSSLAAAGAGLAVGLLAANRPPDLAIALAFGVVAVAHWRAQAVWFVLAAAVPVLLVAWYNEAVFGLAFGGYQWIGAVQVGSSVAWGAAVVAELLASPTRGLFVFSPFLLFLLPFGRRSLHVAGDRLLNSALALGVAGLLLIHGVIGYRVGTSFGPRFLTDCMPIAIWLLAPVVTALRRPAWNVFVFLCVVAIAIQALGAVFYQARSDQLIYGPDIDRATMGPAWRVANAPYVADVRMGPAARPFCSLIKQRLRD
jgi:hypothetical protein